MSSQPTISAWVLNLATRDALVSEEFSLAETINSLVDEVKLFGADAIDSALPRIDVTRARPSHLVAVLSTLFSWRGELSNWNTLRDRTVAEMERRGFGNIESSMGGLLG